MKKITKRLLSVSRKNSRSAFLWGPRKVGKSYWIHHEFTKKGDKIIDLLQTDVFIEYANRPALLRERWKKGIVIIDEIQKVPALLDEVHWLIENKKAIFILTGSSARKLRRGHANLLAGRALRFEMGPLSIREVSGASLEKVFKSGFLPPHFLSSDPISDLRSYVNDYLKEEIVGEALIQNLPTFSQFLQVAALTSSEILNYTNVAQECGVRTKTVRQYFEILEDTFLGFRISPWKKRKERRLVLTDKFYFFDLGVANYLAKRSPQIGNTDFGKSFEHFILLEILHYRRYQEPELEVSFWRTSNNQEVDFILGPMMTAIEVKAKNRVTDADLKNLLLLKEEYKSIPHCLVVSLEKEPRVVKGICILPWNMFLDALWDGKYLR